MEQYNSVIGSIKGLNPGLLCYFRKQQRRKNCLLLSQSHVQQLHMGEMRWNSGPLLCLQQRTRAQLISKGNVINLFSPVDILELFLITAEEKSQVKLLEPMEKKRPRSRIQGFLMQKMK